MSNAVALNLPFVQDYEGIAPQLAGAGIGWLDELRRAALGRYSVQGLPGPRTEAWKYTNLNIARRKAFKTAFEGSSAPPMSIPEGVLKIDSVNLVLVNGRFSPELSDLGNLPGGIYVSSFNKAIEDKNLDFISIFDTSIAGHDMPMMDLNTAFLNDGLVIVVKKGYHIDIPLHVISIGTPGNEAIAFHSRNILSVERGASITILSLIHI